MNKNTLRYLIWVFCVTLWITIFFVLPDFADNPIHDIKGFFQVTLYLIAIGSATFPWIYAFGTYRLISSFMIPIIGLIGAALSFYRIGYHATLTPMLIESILHTNIEETLGVISWQIILWVVLNFCIGLGLVWIRWQRIVLQYSWIHFIIAVLIGTCFYFSNERLHISLRRRFPFNVPYMFYSYKTMRQESLITRQIPTYTPIDIPDSLTIVLIIGEAVRADHLQLNGYKRETTPRLIRRSNIISFPHIYSEETHTIGSLPYILTRADSIHEQFQYSETSFITILKENGYKTAWLSSQDISSTYAYYIAECDTIIFPHPEKAVNIFGKWYDDTIITLYHLQFGNVIFLDRSDYVWVQYQGSISNSDSSDDRLVLYSLLPYLHMLLIPNFKFFFLSQPNLHLVHLLKKSIFQRIRLETSTKDYWSQFDGFIFQYYSNKQRCLLDRVRLVRILLLYRKLKKRNIKDQGERDKMFKLLLG